jgi:predicted transcriptional regulator
MHEKTPKTTISLNIETALKLRLDDAARATRRTRSALVELALEQYFKAEVKQS